MRSARRVRSRLASAGFADDSPSTTVWRPWSVPTSRFAKAAARPVGASRRRLAQDRPRVETQVAIELGDIEHRQHPGLTAHRDLTSRRQPVGLRRRRTRTPSSLEGVAGRLVHRHTDASRFDLRAREPVHAAVRRTRVLRRLVTHADPPPGCPHRRTGTDVASGPARPSRRSSAEASTRRRVRRAGRGGACRWRRAGAR